MDDYADRCSYLNHLRAEHCRLELLAGRVRDQFSLAQESSWLEHDRPAVAAQLAALKQELLKHIDEECRGGCVEEAVSRSPSVAEEAQQVFQENEDLQIFLHHVMQLVEFGSLDEASASFFEFATILKLHEEHEEHVVEKGMNWPLED